MYRDNYKVAGARWDVATQGFVGSLLGGDQSGQGYIFGIPYYKGSFIDMIMESFAGPHDFANSYWFYDAMGNNKTLTGNVFMLNLATNYTTSLMFAAPFAAGAIYEQTYFAAYRGVFR